MAKQELVTVQHLKNPAVKRQMTVASAKLNSNKWKIVGEPVVVEVKKKDVSPVAESPKAKLPNQNHFSGIKPEFEKVDSERTILHAEYEAKTGKKPDGRWNEAKLREKIAEFKPNENEAA